MGREAVYRRQGAHGKCSRPAVRQWNQVSCKEAAAVVAGWISTVLW
jgi:hypothetical protein